MSQRNTYDRTVHAWLPDGREVVRYETAGRWYVEHTAEGRKAITLGVAVELALTGTPVLRLPGGGAFDARIRKAQGMVKP